MPQSPQVKTFKAYDTMELDRQINEWLAPGQYEVIDMSRAQSDSFGAPSATYTCTILYKHRERG